MFQLNENSMKRIMREEYTKRLKKFLAEEMTVEYGKGADKISLIKGAGAGAACPAHRAQQSSRVRSARGHARRVRQRARPLLRRRSRGGNRAHRAGLRAHRRGAPGEGDSRGNRGGLRGGDRLARGALRCGGACRISSPDACQRVRWLKPKNRLP